jgi:hypothetical protein
VVGSDGKTSANFYATGGLTAYGAGSGTPSAGTSYNRLDKWSDYTTDKATYVLSALLGNDLNTRVSKLENSTLTSVDWSIITNKPSVFAPSPHTHAWADITSPTTLLGYGITDANISNGVITLGANSITPLTQHQDISGKSDITHTHTVKINGTTKTIAATGGTAVDLGTYLTSHQSLAHTHTLAIGNTRKSVSLNGSQSWSLSEIGAASTSHKHVWADITDAPTKLSQFTNDSGFITSSAIPTKLSQFTDNILNGHYLPLSGGTMSGTALIQFADDGAWAKSNSGVTFPVKRGGLYWTGESDWVKLFTEETGSDNLDLIIQFGDDNSNRLQIRNASGSETAYITATGVFGGALSGNASSASKVNNALSWSGYSSGSFNGSAAKSISIPNNTSQLTNGAGFITSSASISGNAATSTVASKLGRSGNSGVPMTFNWSGQSGQPNWLWGGSDGTNMYVYNPSNFNVAYASNSGALSGYTESSFLRYRGYLSDASNAMTGINTTGWKSDSANYKTPYGDSLHIQGFSTWYNRLDFGTNRRIYFWQAINPSNLTGCMNYIGTLAYTSDNVASATKLQTQRTLWGQSFDGTGDVNGNINIGNDDIIGSNGARVLQNLGGNLGINPTNNVGIGTTSPSYKLDVAGTGRFQGDLVIGNTIIHASGSNGGINSIQPADDYIIGDCNIGGTMGLKSLNTASAGIGFYGNDGTDNGTLTALSGTLTWTGTICATGGVTAYTTSDRRLKKNIKSIDSLSVIRSLGGTYQFDYRKDNRHSIGFIAQNVRKSELSDIVGELDGYLRINYLDTRLISLALGASVELDDEVTRLKKRVSELEKEVERLKAA